MYSVIQSQILSDNPGIDLESRDRAPHGEKIKQTISLSTWNLQSSQERQNKK